MSRKLPEPKVRFRCAQVRLRTLAALVGVAAAVPASGQESAEPVVRVEEDWQLVLNEPNYGANSPQFHTLMSPGKDTESIYIQATWNYRELPAFQSGGLQLQGWFGDSCGIQRNPCTEQLSNSAETVTWTQSLETDRSSKIVFSIMNGQSTTWGTFGGDLHKITGYIRIPDLNAYSTSVSVQNSWITYGANRVDSLVITQVRRYGSGGLISVDTEPKVIYNLEQDQSVQAEIVEDAGFSF